MEIEEIKIRTCDITKRKRALENYYKKPCICNWCRKLIEPKEGQKISELKVKKFCNQSCSARFYNTYLPERQAIPKELKLKKKKENPKNLCSCGELKRTNASQCITCYTNSRSRDNKTRGSFIDKHTNWWEARVPVAKSARRIYLASNKSKSCNNCGYDKHFEVCHIKAVAEFDRECLLSEINHIDNLVALCRNCHWEFDNELLKIEDILRGQALVG